MNWTLEDKNSFSLWEQYHMAATHFQGETEFSQEPEDGGDKEEHIGVII